MQKYNFHNSLPTPKNTFMESRIKSNREPSTSNDKKSSPPPPQVFLWVLNKKKNSCQIFILFFASNSFQFTANHTKSKFTDFVVFKFTIQSEQHFQSNAWHGQHKSTRVAGEFIIFAKQIKIISLNIAFDLLNIGTRSTGRRTTKAH